MFNIYSQKCWYDLSSDYFLPLPRRLCFNHVCLLVGWLVGLSAGLHIHLDGVALGPALPHLTFGAGPVKATDSHFLKH